MCAQLQFSICTFLLALNFLSTSATKVIANSNSLHGLTFISFGAWGLGGGENGKCTIT